MSTSTRHSVHVIAILVACGLGASACGGKSTLCNGETSPTTGALARGPLVAKVTDSSAVVSWETREPLALQLDYRSPSGAWQSILPEESDLRGRVEIAGLSPATSYEYRLVDGTTTVHEGTSLQTAPADGDPRSFRFAVFGDSGGGCEPQLRVADRVEMSGPEFVLHTGDVLYSTKAKDLEPLFFGPYRNLLSRVPFFLSVGNHDKNTSLLDVVELPTNDANGSERFYSFNWGVAHFVALDSNESLKPDSEQHTWLTDDLSRNESTWTFVYFHHPLYSSSRGGHGTIRKALEPLFSEHGVDMVFNGHDHNYERTHPMRDGMITATPDAGTVTDPEGTIYIVTGAGGRSLYRNGSSDFTAYSESTYHFTSISVEGTTLQLEAIRMDGTTLDTLTVNKTM